MTPSFTTTAANGVDAVVRKYDPMGNLLWAANYDGAAHLDDAAYGVTVDAFLQTHNSPSPANSDYWMRVAASREGQDAFNSLKGSIPARTDPDVSRYDTYQRSAIADFKAARLYPSVGAVAPAA